MGRTADYSQQVCSVAATLEVVGDPWTLLILRDAFIGVRRFEQWQEGLGVARNVLAARLKSLVGHGVLEKRAYSDRPRRYEYWLTAKGLDLFDVLVAMAAWGDRHVYGDLERPVTFLHLACGCRLTPGLVCKACGGDIGPGGLRREGKRGEVTVGEAVARLRAE
jgi:DNA-binding HxlR family transcriptional regulator